ncbi:YcnI family copper-binding membrane protein [Peribacillus deserti]|uniref:YncI copper-binding domain-containing protein n=1 Tax=Peribacillus deserti TaxID=673318 RepID=A0A2N5M9X0_9BACI|nr:DUF1775 domain-containing protein [Peribacillus deserti]PLT31149.1 hypothetical protein CUU66_04120 [Peribacillus deserti]
MRKYAKNKMIKLMLPTFLSLFLFASLASAHVTVTPASSTTGAWETYTVKVPVEKEVATTKITLKTPKGVEFKSYQPVPGWKFSSEKDSSGKVTSITFESTAEGILPGQFQQFVFVAQNPDTASKAAWDAFQYYKDGSVVEWTGDEGSEKPHAITDIVAGTAEDHGHDANNESDQKDDSNDTKAGADENSDSLPLILSIISAVLALAALVVAFRKNNRS